MSLYSKSELLEALSEINVIPADQLAAAVSESKKKGVLLEDRLVDRDLISDSNLGKVVADLVGYPFIDLSDVSIPKETLNLVPEIYARTQSVVAFKQDREGLHLATPDPSNTEGPKFVGKKTGFPIKVYYTTKRSFEEAVGLYAKDVGEVFSEIIASHVSVAQGTKKPEPSIVRIVDTIITYAYRNKSSDIHIEPSEAKSIVRFRVDGILHDIVSLPADLHPQIVTRIKVMARLRTDEHHSAQDGRVTFKLKEEDLDIRVSVVPVTKGEKIVMRLLSERSRSFSLSDLGLSGTDLKKVGGEYQRPHGMVLATGPTGCGKTTTLYAMLKILNRRAVNIMTIEDPVEYEVAGVNQIQVDPRTNLTFAEGLKSIVRQNPDIILVGEIRDDETAGIAINAAMTGHLVLSTLHTNDAATAFPRLLDFKIEPYLVASTVNVVIAQRLVRRICVQCRYSFEVNTAHDNVFGQLPTELVKKYFGAGNIKRIYKAKGCPVCHQTGYVGREGIFEVLVVDERVREAISAKKAASEIQKIAVVSGMKTMLENGIEKVRKGITTLEEVLRVIKE